MGLGYIGLPTALVAANNNFFVSGFDIDQNKINSINDGVCPIVEPGIQELLTKVIKEKKFSASNKLKSADCFVIAVPTPFKNSYDKKLPDLTYVFDAAKFISKKISKGNLVILESTVPVGTTEKLGQFLEEKTGLKLGKDFFLAYCPERVLPGKIISELIKNDRIIGGTCENSAKLAKNFYKKFVQGKCHLTNDKSAEMIKLIENSFRDVQIAFANQVSSMCEVAKIDPFETIKLANKHPRVNILQPGCGVGGHCIAVDPWFLIEGFPKDSELLKITRKINDEKPKKVISQTLKQAKDFYKKYKKKPKVLALGLTFKPDVDDLRESPALQIALELNKQKDFLELFVCDPFVTNAFVKKERFSALGLNKVDLKNIENFDFDILLALVKHTCFAKTFFIKKFLTRDKFINPCGLKTMETS